MRSCSNQLLLSKAEVQAKRERQYHVSVDVAVVVEEEREYPLTHPAVTVLLSPTGHIMQILWQPALRAATLTINVFV